MLAAPHCYCVRAQCALEQALFAQADEAQLFLLHLEEIRLCYDLRIYGYAISKNSYAIILQHQERILDRDDILQNRWQKLTGSHKFYPANVLRDRFNDLTQIMKSLNQGYSRAYHQRHGGRGSIWAERYRSCLLADDTAIIACMSWIDTQQGHIVKYPNSPSKQHTALPLISPAPLREVAQKVIIPSDEAPLGTVPPLAEEWPLLLQDFFHGISNESRDIYATAISKGWALGKAESLVPCLSQLSRSEGRGRSRQLRDLNDDLGLCGVWG